MPSKRTDHAEKVGPPDKDLSATYKDLDADEQTSSCVSMSIGVDNRGVQRVVRSTYANCAAVSLVKIYIRSTSCASSRLVLVSAPVVPWSIADDWVATDTATTAEILPCP